MVGFGLVGKSGQRNQGPAVVRMDPIFVSSFFSSFMCIHIYIYNIYIYIYLKSQFSAEIEPGDLPDHSKWMTRDTSRNPSHEGDVCAISGSKERMPSTP